MINRLSGNGETNLVRAIALCQRSPQINAVEKADFRVATRVRIDGIKKDDRKNPYERIERVGGPNAAGAAAPRWNLPLNDAIKGALDGQWVFYVHVGGHSVDVHVAKSRWGNLYLKTVADRDTPDNLLSLPTLRA